VYQIGYFVRGLLNFPENSVLLDSSGFNIGIVINSDLGSPIGIRNFPPVPSPLLDPSECLVWGTHRVFHRLNQNDKVQLVIFSLPEVDDMASREMVSKQVERLTTELIYLEILKVSS
jgi:hypothetical protein